MLAEKNLSKKRLKKMLKLKKTNNELQKNEKILIKSLILLIEEHQKHYKIKSK